MKKSRFSESQIISTLKQAESGTPVPELCREHGMSSGILQVAQQIWRHGRLHDYPYEGTRRGEPATTPKNA